MSLGRYKHGSMNRDSHKLARMFSLPSKCFNFSWAVPVAHVADSSLATKEIFSFSNITFVSNCSLSIDCIIALYSWHAQSIKIKRCRFSCSQLYHRLSKYPSYFNFVSKCTSIQIWRPSRSLDACDYRVTKAQISQAVLLFTLSNFAAGSNFRFP